MSKVESFEKGLSRYFTEGELDRIRQVTVGIAGAGGLGSNCALLLARSGFQHFIIADYDHVEPSNLNRQQYTLDQVGQAKVAALIHNLQAVNPAVKVHSVVKKLSPGDLPAVFKEADVLVEAFDDPAMKEAFAECFGGRERLVVVSSGIAGCGTGNRIRTRQISPGFFLVGDEATGIDQAPPLAPAVTISAAKQADIVLGWVLGKTTETANQKEKIETEEHAPKAYLPGRAIRSKLMEAFFVSGLYGITASNRSAGRTNEEVVTSMLKGGIRFIQYREKHKSADRCYEECLRLRTLTRKWGAVFIVNDFVDIAMAVDADGVHIGQHDLPPRLVRQLVGPDKIIGLSTHGREQLQAANELMDIIDYVGIGPVFATTTKPEAAPVGLDYVRYAAAESRLPFVAIGGITAGNIDAVLGAGAKTVSIVSGLAEAADVKRMAEALREKVISRMFKSNSKK